MRDIAYDDVRQMIRDAVTEAGSQAEFARKAGVSYQTVSVVLQGLTPGEKILDAIGIERVITYRRKAP